MSYQRFLLISALTASWAISPASAQVVSTPGSGTTSPGGPITLPGGVVTTPLMINRTYVFPPVTLATTETARLIVVNTAVASTIVPPPVTPVSTTMPGGAGTSAAPACTGTLSFLTSNTVMLTPPSTTFTLAAGQFAFLDLPYSKSGLGTPPAGEPAGEVVGEVQLGVPIPQVAGCSLQMSLVTYDASTGAGHLVLGNAAANQIGPVPILAIGAR